MRSIKENTGFNILRNLKSAFPEVYKAIKLGKLVVTSKPSTK